MSATPTTLKDKLNYIRSIKANIKQAIEKKGVTVDGAFSTYPECINSIETGGSDELAKGLIQRNIADVIIPDGTTRIGDSAFMNFLAMQSVTIPDSVESIGTSVFNGCSSLRSVTIPNGVTSIGESAFNACNSLTSITIPDGVTSLENYTFASCTGLTSVALPKYLTSIGDDAFEWCSSLTSVTIPSGVTSIGNYAFNGCSALTSVTIPSGVTSIGVAAFTSCSALTSVTIPSGVTSIGDYTFQNCSALTSVTIENSTTKLQYNSEAFANIASNAILYVPEGLLSEYQADSSWTGAFAEIRAIGSEPAAYTITGVSLSSSDPNDNTLALCGNYTAVFGYANIIDVTLFGTGLSDTLDYANIINVSDDGSYITNFNFIQVNAVAQDGTWVTVRYDVTINENTYDYVTQYAENISFQWNGTTFGTLDVSIFTVKSYEFTGGTDTTNKYPNSMTAYVRTYLPTGSGTDLYMNEKAQMLIANNILHDCDFTIQNTSAKCGFDEQDAAIAWVDIQYSIQPSNESTMNVRLKWGDGGTVVNHTFEAASE